MDYLLHCSIISVASRTPPQNVECRPVEKSEDIGSILCNLGSFTSFISLGLSCSKKAGPLFFLLGVLRGKHFRGQRVRGVESGLPAPPRPPRLPPESPPPRPRPPARRPLPVPLAPVAAAASPATPPRPPARARPLLRPPARLAPAVRAYSSPPPPAAQDLTT